LVIHYQKYILKIEVIVLHTVLHEFGEITQNKDQYAVQGHSRSWILVPIESPYYTTSYGD